MGWNAPHPHSWHRFSSDRRSISKFIWLPLGDTYPHTSRRIWPNKFGIAHSMLMWAAGAMMYVDRLVFFADFIVYLTICYFFVCRGCSPLPKGYCLWKSHTRAWCASALCNKLKWILKLNLKHSHESWFWGGVKLSPCTPNYQLFIHA